MAYLSGIIFAFIALLSWGFGDFFIQKTTRLVGSWKALFYIAALGSIVLFPFIFGELFTLNQEKFLILIILSVIVVFGALFDFEAMRQGKIAIVEPIIGLELPLTVGLGITLGHEQINFWQGLLIFTVFIGIILAITAHQPNYTHKKLSLEKGVILAGIAAIGMALTNFMIGTSSQSTSPLMTVWFSHTVVALVCLIYLVLRHQLKSTFSDLKKYPLPILAESIFDNSAWISFAFATTFIPISIATTISESYIALTVLLGLFVGKEKLHRYQIFGAFLAISGIIALSAISQ
jgi:drug/metabolite transporter (DMT)-like permease